MNRYKGGGDGSQAQPSLAAITPYRQGPAAYTRTRPRPVPPRPIPPRPVPPRPTNPSRPRAPPPRRDHQQIAK